MIRSDKRRVTEDLLCRAKFLSTEEMAKLLGRYLSLNLLLRMMLLGLLPALGQKL